FRSACALVHRAKKLNSAQPSPSADLSPIGRKSSDFLPIADLWVFSAGALNLEEVWILRQAHCGIKDLAGFFTGWNAGNNGAEEGGVTELNYWGSHVITHRGDCFIVECTKCLISIFRVSNLSIGCIQASIRQSFVNQLVISSKALLTALFFTVYLVAQDGVKLINLGGFFGCNLGKSEEHTSELQSRFDLVCRLL